MNFQETMSAQLSYLKRRANLSQNELSKLPPGKMVTKTSRNKKYYYEKRNGKLYNLKDQPKKIAGYLKRVELEKDQSIITENIRNIEKLLKNYTPLPVYPNNWDAFVPNQNAYKPEELIHEYNGTFYRSKSEALIATMLTSFHIEFKYEPQLNINGYNVYPDFVIKRPKDGKIFIYEHFGLITEEAYLHKTFNKINNYHKAGYNLWDNLLISFDQSDGSINIDTIEKIIRLFLL